MIGIVDTAPSANSVQPNARRTGGDIEPAASKPSPAPAIPRVNATMATSGSVTL